MKLRLLCMNRVIFHQIMLLALEFKLYSMLVDDVDRNPAYLIST